MKVNHISMTMGRCLTFAIGFLCVIYISGQTTQKICWDTKWYNDSGILSNRSNYEHQTVKVLNRICISGPVIAAQCKDNKGEPFEMTKNDTVSRYIATCNHVNGLICHPYKNDHNATCPDFAIRYGCSCSTTTTIGRTGVGLQGNGNQTSASGQHNNHFRNNGQNYGISHTVLLLCMIVVKVTCKFLRSALNC